MEPHSPTPKLNIEHANSEVAAASLSPRIPHTRNNTQTSTKRTLYTGPVIVAIAGASGSGKTSIASMIANRLQGGGVLTISCDSYYHSLPKDIAAEDYNFDHPDALDLDLLGLHLAALKNGQNIQVPVYDFTTHKRLETTTFIDAKSTSVVIVDGIFALWADAVAKHCDIKLFCSESLDICLVRRLRRDISERGRTSESVLSQYIRFVKPGM